jgi:DNA-binding response OmpR family regulator
MKPTIIVLEDDADIANLMKHHLHQAGFDVFVSSASEKVLPLAREHSPVLFILDIMVPGSNGFEVCRQIRGTKTQVKARIHDIKAKTTSSKK